MSLSDSFSHRELCTLAVKWLNRVSSAGGPGCNFAVSEIASGSSGEMPDAIGWRGTQDDTDGSVLVEVKCSRSDFLADKKKPHRNQPDTGLGDWRFYMCPEGLIKECELPDNWGLLYVNKRGHVKTIAGFTKEKSYGPSMAIRKSTRCEKNAPVEMRLLIRLLRRVGDPEKVRHQLSAADQIGYRYESLQRDMVDIKKALQNTKKRFKYFASKSSLSVPAEYYE